MTRSLAALALLAAALAAPQAAEPRPDEAAIVHVLNRVTFGPRPGDVDAVRAMGIERYIDQQLQPERLPEPAASAWRMFPPAAGRGGGRAQIADLAQAKLWRAIHSERQLEEVLVDFWFNHFNVDARKGPVRAMVAEYESTAIRPHVLGRFRDLLGATAASPAMLFYLDNWLSGGERGLNENYARELMELHTLGVDGGYTQRDATEVARAFTGWTIDAPRVRGGFRFARGRHDAGPGTVLGRRISGRGMDAGEQVLALLAAHPSTARHISYKLARRFVSDAPPEDLVDRLAARFTATNGDLREVTRALLMSPEFLAPAARGAKVKTALEFVVSAVRASGGDLRDPRLLLRALQQLGMAPYQCQPPTGYQDTADAWVNAGALVARMNVAQALANGLPRQHSLAIAVGSPDFQRR